jgi:hypothetical protein
VIVQWACRLQKHRVQVLVERRQEVRVHRGATGRHHEARLLTQGLHWSFVGLSLEDHQGLEEKCPKRSCRPPSLYWPLES